MAANHFHGSLLQYAFMSGMNDRIKPYRMILNIYREFHEAVVAENNDEVKVYRIYGKLELFEVLFNDGVMMDVKEKLERELALAQARLSDVKVPNLNWEKLGEPQMWP
ncbi:unnamed protein product [Eruca vesicaria subsp. sativa]|uniref:Uncharacterized protein n=1 Tax=Eruca vesicaria subsp. sativa TaxID=29727 RepID=A0ABC8M7D2_ERUVS|nr:unnamed protein product [Eruca vesicaria subsp. sativa]